jgi:hypothetical protein
MGLKAADPADQKRRSMRFMVVEINVPRVTDTDQKLPAASLLLGYDPRRRSPNLQDLVAAVGGENSDSRVGHGKNPDRYDTSSLGQPKTFRNTPWKEGAAFPSPLQNKTPQGCLT